MLERKVLIDGTVYDRHELVMVTIQPSSPEIVTVRSSHSDTEDDTMTETAHECELSDTVDFSKWEEIVWALPAFEEYVDKGEILDNVLDILTDEQAETMPQLYPEWKAGTEYDVGKRVRYGEKLYRCVQAHTSQEGWEPDKTPALWTRVAKEGEIPEWVHPTGAQDAYNTGDKVKHNGKTWVSTADNNVWEPGVYGWDEVS